MSGESLARHYRELTPDERFRLVIAAKARGDTTEEDRLIDACPTVSVSMNDPAFVQRWLTAEELVKSFVADTARFFGWLDLLDLLRDPVARAIDDLCDSARCFPTAGDEPPDDHGASENETSDAVEDDDGANTDGIDYPLIAMEAAHNAALAIVRARWEAFAACCDEDVGVDAAALLRAMWPPMLDRIETLPPGVGPVGARHPERYEESRDEWRDKAAEVWRLGIERC